jgi:hypothetical protein
MKNVKKCLIWVVFGPPPWGNDPTLTIFDGWQDFNPPKVYTKYENNPFKIVVCSLRKPKQFATAAEMAAADGTKTKVSPTSSGDTIKCTKLSN